MTDITSPRSNVTADRTARIRAILQAQLPVLRERYGVKTLGLFGSYVRGEEQPDSDLDVIVELDNRPLSLLKFIELENHLSSLLNTPVDLVEKHTLKPAIGRRILREVVPV